jgi:predicted nuclease of predicted toxin-antitoxin system
MRFLVDAQLPRRLARWIQQQGYEATHTLDLPRANRTSDTELKQLSLQQQMVVITKDSDFADNLLLHQNLYKLVLVCTGNISNDALMGLFQRNWETLLQLLREYTFIELGSEAILVRW